MTINTFNPIEAFARPFMVAEAGPVFKHIDRVRRRALRIAAPLVEFMRAFVVQLEAEVCERSGR